MSGISASPPSFFTPLFCTSQPQLKMCKIRCGSASISVVHSLSPQHLRQCSSSDLKLKRMVGLKFGSAKRLSVHCSSSTPGGPGSGETESKSILDAFFLGRALAEALNERIESTVGELLSAVGRLQAEQQKQVQDFQEDVLERAKKAKEKAAREAMEAQEPIPKSNTVVTAASDVAPPPVSPPAATDVATPPVSPSPADPTTKTNNNNDPIRGFE